MADPFNLLIQTVLDETQIALFHGQNRISEVIKKADFKSDNTFVRDIVDCMKNAHIIDEEIQSVTILTGPGYFTGIRAGIVIAKAWMDVKSIPVRLVSSFDYIRECIPAEDHPVILIKASKTEAYAGYYNFQSLTKQVCIRMDTPLSQEWSWYTSSVSFRMIPNVHYIHPLPHLPMLYNEVTRSDQIFPQYGRSLDELFQSI
jgi:tRNA threonylcarbamoyl adenosine modification protein YeaZ